MFATPGFLLFHVVISVLGIIAGLVVVGGLIGGRRLDGWTGFFLVTTVLTSVTGFFFPFVAVGPPHIVGVISLVVLVPCLAAFYWKHLAGGWRTVFVVTAVVALYLNVFVLVVQLFAKTPPLAPLQNQAPFALTHLLVLALFVYAGSSAVRGFRAVERVS